VRPFDQSEAPAAIASGEVDVYLGPNDQIWPDTYVNLTLFHDAAGAIARHDVGIRQLTDMKFVTVCLVQDSIEERLFNEAAQAARVKVQPLLFNADDTDGLYTAYDQGRCDVVVDNRVRLAQHLPELTVPRDQTLLELTLPIGTRGPVTANDDPGWIDVVNAVSGSLTCAESLGIHSSTLDTALAGDTQAVLELLGVAGTFGADHGLANDFAARIIRHVGNYAELYDRYFPDLPRGSNALIDDGGYIDAPCSRLTPAG